HSLLETMTKSEVLSLAKEQKVAFINVMFTDLLGVMKAITIPVSKLEDAIESNVWFDGSSVEGFARISESDMYLKLELNTFTVIMMKYALKSIAMKYDLHCTFMPKPIAGINGSGMHVHQSLFSPDGKKNLMHDPAGEYQLSSLAKSYIAGQLVHIKAMNAILNPTVNSYKRLVVGYE